MAMCFSVALAVALAMAGCNRKTIFSHYVAIDQSGWERTDTMHFAVAHIPLTDRYVETIGLRITSHYPFTALTVIADQHAVPSGIQRTDTLCCRLTDESGTVMGSGLTHYQYLFPLPPLPLSEGDSLSVSIRHHMMRETLPGVTDVGLIVCKEPAAK